MHDLLTYSDMLIAPRSVQRFGRNPLAGRVEPATKFLRGARSVLVCDLARDASLS